tara:strand:+ start:649 stop:954 length:306 start_codon:yes stop_codon:yes gene_type:complete
MALTEKLKQKINAHSFEWDREERLAKSMEDIFRLVSSRDFSNLRQFQTTKLGNALLDIAEEFAITQTGLIKDFRTFANTGKLPEGDPINETLKKNLDNLNK